MTNEKAISIIKNAFSWYEDNARESEEEDWSGQHEALRMAIKALEPKPMEKFDDVKTHIQRLAGDYKCWDNRLTWEEALELNRMLEAQPSEEDFVKHKKEVLERIAKREREIDKYIKELEVLEQQPCEDCISREEMLKYQQYLHGKMSNEENHKLWNFIKGLPSVKPKYSDEEIDKAQAVEQAYVDKMVELAVEESRREWLESFDTSSATKCFEAVNLLKQRLEGEEWT